MTSCGSHGPRVISNKGGEVERGEFLFENLPQAPAADDYLVHYSDELDVAFFYNSDYDVAGIKVRPDGKISLPYVGEIQAAGRSVAQLDSIITEAYSRIVLEPEVTVILKRFDEPVIYVLGEVLNAGAYDLQRDLTLLGALANGRINTQRADKRSVLVIRRVSHDHIIGMQFDMIQLTEGGRFDLDIKLKPSDIVYVPTSSLKKAEDFISAVYNILNDPLNLYLRGWQVANVQILYEFYRNAGQQQF
jgi:polysaccharide export outer membrane protein